jgi:hypothetical protein
LEVNGVYAVTKASVVLIEGQECKIIEVIENSNCQSQFTLNCIGDVNVCYRQVLSRVLVCPNGMISNTIGISGGKFPREEIK